MSDFADHIAAEQKWLVAREEEWASLWRKFGGLIIKFSGLGASCLLAILLLPPSPSSSLFFSAMMFFCILMICVSASSLEHCRRWLDWHAEVQADPYAYPWPPLPSE